MVISNTYSYHFGLSLPLDTHGETPINTNGSYRSGQGRDPPPCAGCNSPWMRIRNTSVNLTAAWKPQSQGWGSAGKDTFSTKLSIILLMMGPNSPPQLCAPHVSTAEDPCVY